MRHVLRHPLQAWLAVAAVVALVASACGSASSVPATAPVADTVAPTATATLAPTPTLTIVAAPSPTASASPSATATPVPTPTRAPTPIPTPESAISPQLLAKLTQIEQRVLPIRGLQQSKATARRFVNRDELLQRMKVDLDKDSSDLAIAQQVLQLLGLMQPSDDLKALQLSLLGQQVAGFYEPDTGNLYVVGNSDTFDLVDEVTYAHEFTHGLQQGTFDIDALQKAVKDNSEASAALTALIEGDAVVSQTLYAQKHVDIAKLNSQLTQRLKGQDLSKIPQVLQQSLNFPYTEGLQFVFGLYQEGGYNRVNQAFKNPPTTTEQIIHPDKYRAGEGMLPVTMPDLVSALGAGWREVKPDIIGELTIRQTLEQYLSRADAAKAAAGWGGDRLSYLNGPNGERLLVDDLRWDTINDAVEFFSAYRTWLATQRAQITVDTPTRLEARTGDRVHVLTRLNDTVAWIISTDAQAPGKILPLFMGI
ncbi:MAG: hypothetical protein HY261_10940 [Chloroflexi bacterium]|nr:hypothetical protein [Chloroflexota bacterium]